MVIRPLTLIKAPAVFRLDMAWVTPARLTPSAVARCSCVRLSESEPDRSSAISRHLAKRQGSV